MDRTKMTIDDATKVAKDLMNALIAAGMDDEEQVSDLTASILGQHNPDALRALGEAAVRSEIRSVAQQLGVGL